MVVINKYSSTQIGGLSSTTARVVYDSTINALRFNNAASYSNVLVAKDLLNNLSNINNVFTSGVLGLNTTSASKQLEINSTTGDCLRLTYNNNLGTATNYVDVLVNSTGDLNLTPSGGNVNITTHNGTTAGLRLANVLVTATAEQLNYLNTEPGSAMANKAIILDENRNLINVNYLETSAFSSIATNPEINTVTCPASIITIPTTTVAAGFGTGIEFDLVNDAGNIFSSGFINNVMSITTNNLESAYFEFKLANGGVVDTVATLSNNGVMTSTTFVETSDVRVKKNILSVNESYSMSKLLDIDIKSYNYTFDNSGKLHTGVIAQEIEKILPEVIEISKKYGLDDFHSVHYSGLIPHLINAVKLLKREINELKEKL